MSAFVTPVAAGQGSGRGQERELRGQGSRLILSEPLSKEMKNLIKLRGADIKIIDKVPVLELYGRDKDMYIPFHLPATLDILLDNEIVSVETDGTYLLIPVEGKIEKICISEFNIKEIKDGQILLVGHVNPLVKIIIGIVGLAASAIALHDAISSAFSSDAIQTSTVNRVLFRGSTFSISDFNFSVPRPLRNVAVAIRVTDVEIGETVRVSLVGGGIVYRFNQSLPVTGNNATMNAIFRVCSNDLDMMDILFRDTHGRPTVRIEKTHGSESVTVNQVSISVDW